jgi:hypothetical protein
MQIAVRSYLTAGIALVGAGAIIASPVFVAPAEVHIPATHVSATSVELAALTNPVTEWVQVLQTSVTNLATLGMQVQSDPAPILQQFITNQLASLAIAAPALEQAFGSVVSGVTAIPAALITAANQLAAGHFNDAVQTVFQAGLALVLGPAISLLSLPVIITTATQNFANVVAAIPNVLLPIGLSAIAPIGGAVAAFGASGQAFVDAVGTGDAEAAINAIVNAPAAMTDAILNGIPAQGTVGLLTPYSGPFSSGLIATLLNARDTFAQALGAPVPPALSATSEVAHVPTVAKTITLSTAAPTPLTSETPTVAEKSTAATKSAQAAPTAKSVTVSEGSKSDGVDTSDESASADQSSTSTGSTAVGKHRAQSGKSAASDHKKSRDSVKKSNAG